MATELANIDYDIGSFDPVGRVLAYSKLINYLYEFKETVSFRDMNDINIFHMNEIIHQNMCKTIDSHIKYFKFKLEEAAKKIKD